TNDYKSFDPKIARMSFGSVVQDAGCTLEYNVVDKKPHLTISYLRNVANTDDGKDKMEFVEHCIKLEHERSTSSFFYKICRSDYFPDEVMSVLSFQVHEQSDNYIPGYI
ncbi:MAG: hypothetical protein ACK56I_09530, partial [bacterium]